MKNHNLITGLALGLGVAIGWFAKPQSSSSTLSVAGAASAARSDLSTEPSGTVKRTQREPRAQGGSEAPSQINSSEKPSSDADVSKMVIRHKQNKLQQRIDYLAEKIDLTSGQKSRLAEWLKGQMKKVESVDLSNPSSATILAKIANSFTNETLEAELANSLTSEQKNNLADLTKKEFRRKVDTSALKLLSKLQNELEFDEDQRDEVYKVLTQNAEKNLLEESKNSRPPDLTDLFGVVAYETDPYDLQLPEVGITTEKFDQRLKEKINQMRSILDAKQLETYRTYLESQRSQTVQRTENERDTIIFQPQTR
jgi:hypothetical protein